MKENEYVTEVEKLMKEKEALEEEKEYVAFDKALFKHEDTIRMFVRDEFKELCNIPELCLYILDKLKEYVRPSIIFVPNQEHPSIKMEQAKHILECSLAAAMMEIQRELMNKKSGE